ncbi:hypothetical protein CKO28_19325 [Rhodovibrio sodomensis]|uniref:Uncharacterized protein n=1 Tax=Rhodovibrio sodomensis TaxID=1088 RepID=A0ABS1DK91_9PROT|nr:hypothetical protein [Rhodovibrio sodomensis]
MMQKWFRKAAGAAIAAGVSVAASTAVAQGSPAGRYDHMMWNGGWAHWIMGPFMMILFVGLLVFAVVAVIRWLGPPEQRGRQAGGSSARHLGVILPMSGGMSPFTTPGIRCSAARWSSICGSAGGRMRSPSSN